MKELMEDVTALMLNTSLVARCDEMWTHYVNRAVGRATCSAIVCVLVAADDQGTEVNDRSSPVDIHTNQME